MSRKKLILIDGSSYLYRAFHALPPLSNRHGEPTGALFGVVNMLRAILKENPDYLAFVQDASGPTFRDELFAEYKANRPPMPDDLRAQVQPMLDIVEALGIPILRVQGVEADDVIGTLATQAAAQDIEVKVSTSDKDFAQLVNEHITLINTMSNTLTDIKGVQEKFGVPPERIIDYLALMGDKVDNIPGVEKCGPKTAAKWLAEYGSLQNVIDNADKVGGKIGENLRAALPQLPLSYQLATIKLDVPLDLSPNELAQRSPVTEKLRELYIRYEFNNALKELDAPASAASASSGPAKVAPATSPQPPAPIAAKIEREYELVLTEAALKVWIEKLTQSEVFAFDTETTSVDAQVAELVGISVCCEPGKAAYIPVAHEYPGAPTQLDRQFVLGAMREVLSENGPPKIGQNAKYDINVMARHGVAVGNMRYDTMLESYVLNSTATRHDMDSLARFYLNESTITFAQVAGKGAKQILFSQVDLQHAGEYAAEDADITFRLHQTLRDQLAKAPSLQKVYDEIDQPLVPVLARMEALGVLIDAKQLKLQSGQLRKRMQELIEQAHKLVGHSFNLDSPKQLQAILFEELKLPVVSKTPKGQPSTGEDVLEELRDQHVLPGLILEYRGMAKLVSTYTEKLPEQINSRTGRVHTSFHQAVAATGRLSSSDPNLQNIPIRTDEGRRIRQAFIAPEGFQLMAADYSQIELRIMAHLAQDPGLLKAFQNNVDVHSATAAEVFGVALDEVTSENRRAAKAINFGLMYGMSAHGLARQLGINRSQAQVYMDVYFSRYPAVHGFMESVREKARRDGYVETAFGRRLYLREINSRNGMQRQGAERAAINAPMQGTAADIIKRAMIAVDAWLHDKPEKARMVLQVHDELVLEVSESATDEIRQGLIERMSNAAELSVPLVVDVGVGANWDVAH